MIPMKYKQDYTKPFLKDIKKVKKNKALINRLDKKIEEILENPEHHKPLKRDLKGKRRTHIGSYILVFEIKKDIIVFHTFKHHDYAYGKK